MSNNKFKLAFCQLRTEPEIEETLAKTEKMLREAAENGAQVAVLPELFCCRYRNAAFREFSTRGSGDVVELLRDCAKRYSLLLVGGSVPEVEDGRMYNSAYVFDRHGEQLAKYRKLHLFDVDLPTLRSCESDFFTPGDSLCVFDSEFGRMGLAICFDLRFPEEFRALAMRGAELVFLPAQFTSTTGPRHWEALLHARAMDNQIFMAGCGAATDERIRWRSWGHSMLVDPYATTLCEGGSGEEIIYSEVDLSRVDEVRRSLPVLPQLRRDLYPVAE